MLKYQCEQLYEYCPIFQTHTKLVWKKGNKKLHTPSLNEWTHFFYLLQVAHLGAKYHTNNLIVEYGMLQPTLPHKACKHFYQSTTYFSRLSKPIYYSGYVLVMEYSKQHRLCRGFNSHTKYRLGYLQKITNIMCRQNISIDMTSTQRPWFIKDGNRIFWPDAPPITINRARKILCHKKFGLLPRLAIR